MKWIIGLLETIYHFLSGTKNALYDAKIISPVKVGVPVVSVGNLSFGGVGKTPFVIFLAQELSLENRVSVVSRSYKTNLKQPLRVDVKKPSAAEIYGDEACVLQKALPQAEVWSGPQKSDSAKYAVRSEFKPDVVIVDDGFSHRKLYRQFDILLIDATVGFSGPLRETIGNLKRAHAVVITKVNLATTERVEQIKNQIFHKAPHLKSSVYTSSIKTLLDIPKSDALFVFCGLAQPDSLITELKQQGYKIAGHAFFNDHHLYSDMDQRRVLAQYSDIKNSSRGARMVTTLKDYVKLTNVELLAGAVPAGHVLMMDEFSKEELVEKIRACL